MGVAQCMRFRAEHRAHFSLLAICAKVIQPGCATTSAGSPRPPQVVLVLQSLALKWI